MIPKFWVALEPDLDGMSGNGYSLWVLPRKMRGTSKHPTSQGNMLNTQCTDMMGWRGQHGERPKDGACDKSLKQPEPSMSNAAEVLRRYPWSMWSSPSSRRSFKPKYVDCVTWGSPGRQGIARGQPKQERVQLLAMFTLRPRPAKHWTKDGTKRANCAALRKKQMASSMYQMPHNGYCPAKKAGSSPAKPQPRHSLSKWAATKRPKRTGEWEAPCWVPTCCWTCHWVSKSWNFSTECERIQWMILLLFAVFAHQWSRRKVRMARCCKESKAEEMSNWRKTVSSCMPPSSWEQAFTV